MDILLLLENTLSPYSTLISAFSSVIMLAAILTALKIAHDNNPNKITAALHKVRTIPADNPESTDSRVYDTITVTVRNHSHFPITLTHNTCFIWKWTPLSRNLFKWNNGIEQESHIPSGFVQGEIAPGKSATFTLTIDPHKTFKAILESDHCQSGILLKPRLDNITLYVQTDDGKIVRSFVSEHLKKYLFAFDGRQPSEASDPSQEEDTVEIVTIP